MNSQPIESYAYNPSTGNLATKAGVSYTYDANHPHAVASQSNSNSYQQDANGNQTTRTIVSGPLAGTYNLYYDAENRLVEVKKNSSTIAAYTYNGDGRQVQSVVNSVTATLFIGAHYQVEGGMTTKYYYAGPTSGQRVAMRTDGTLYYLLGDQLGSTSLTTDSAGNVISELRYTAWGEVRYQAGTTPTNYTYTGQYSNTADFGLMFYNARWYDPAIGRFAQADTIIPGGVQGYDRYAYTNNNPVKYIDPSGHFSCEGKSGYQCRIAAKKWNEANKQTDVTAWLYNQFGPEAMRLIQNWGCPASNNFAQCFTFLYLSHYDLFSNGKHYDIKLKMLNIIGPAVTLCGANGCRWIDYSAPGNIFFGFLSAARGISQPIAWAVGGLREQLDLVEKGGAPDLTDLPAWLDNPGDKAAVDFGFNLYKLYGADITWNEFQNALTTDILDTFQIPNPYPTPFQMPLPQENTYSSWEFYNNW